MDNQQMRLIKYWPEHTHIKSNHKIVLWCVCYHGGYPSNARFSNSSN